MTVLKKLSVTNDNKSLKYSILIGDNFSESLEKNFSKTLRGKKIFVMYDEFFYKLKLIKNLIDNFKKLSTKLSSEIFFFKTKSKDKFKNFENLSNLLNYILSHKINRDSIIISIGGGVTGDLVGFASSIVLRGVKCIHIPTTLLSQVDSSVGGKTGINTKHGKNLVGAFHQPEGVLIDINFLKTLPERELFAGFAEVIKYSFIYDKKFFKYLENNTESIKKLKSPYIENTIFKSCQIKAKIVSIDEKEQGIRAILNFGHTFAHAFESTLGYTNKLNHGEAVLLGILAASKFSNEENLLSKGELELIEKHISELKYNNLKIYFKKKNVNKILKFMKSDKKNNSKDINLILLKKISKPVLNNTYSQLKIKKFINSLINN